MEQEAFMTLFHWFYLRAILVVLSAFPHFCIFPFYCSFPASSSSSSSLLLIAIFED